MKSFYSVIEHILTTLSVTSQNANISTFMVNNHSSLDHKSAVSGSELQDNHHALPCDSSQDTPELTTAHTATLVRSRHRDARLLKFSSVKLSS